MGSATSYTCTNSAQTNTSCRGEGTYPPNSGDEHPAKEIVCWIRIDRSTSENGRYNSLGSRAIQHWAMATSSSPAPGIDEISNERATAAICRDSQVKLYGCGGRRRRASGKDRDKRRRALRARVGRHVSTLGAIYSRLSRHRMLRLDRRASRVLRRSRRHTKKKDDRIGIHKRKWPHEQAVLIISRPTLYVAAQAYAHHTLSPLSHPLGQVVQRVSSASTPR
jgi:hypothetical protein